MATSEALASAHSREDLNTLATRFGIENPDSYNTKLELADALIEHGYTGENQMTTFDAVNSEGIPVVNTPLNEFGLPDPNRVVTAAYRDDDGNITYEGGD